MPTKKKKNAARASENSLARAITATGAGKTSTQQKDPETEKEQEGFVVMSPTNTMQFVFVLKQNFWGRLCKALK